MNWWFTIPLVVWTLWVFVFGLAIGSFLNVLIARLPFERSVLWPGSRCGACLRPIRFADNLPLYGYLRLGGRCRFCKTRFSSRYLWVELFTGLALAGLFLVEIVANIHHVPLFASVGGPIPAAVPPIGAWLYLAAHGFLLAMLLASAIIDIDYRIIPPHITRVGTLIGLGVSILFPWPWPHALSAVPAGIGWNQAQFAWKLPTGLAMWPAWETPGWAPPGSWQFGLLTGVVGALAGMFAIRALKFLFEYGFDKEAVGLGDADLLMMAGAFLGWQPVVLAIPVGAFVTLLVLPFIYVGMKLLGRSFPRYIPFGPGLAAGVVVCWLGWTAVFGELVRTVFFDPFLLGFGTVTMFGLLLVAGLVLKRT